MGTAHYIPAISEKMNYCWEKDVKYKGFDMTWFSENAFFKHDYALQCGFYGINWGHNWREKMKFPKHHILLGDSGGFQIATFTAKGKKINIEPIEILRWLENNCDIGFGIDVPPGTVETINNYNPGFFEKCHKKSLENYRVFEKHRQNFRMKMYYVIHGYNYEQLDRWYNSIKDFNFEGFGMGSALSANPFHQALGGLYLYFNGELKKKGLHYFGTSGMAVMAVLSYLAHKTKSKITYDSSSYSIGDKMRVYQMPMFMGEKLLFGDVHAKYNPEFTDELPCDCPVCKHIDIKDLLGTDTRAGTLLSLHNLYQYLELNRRYNILAKNRSRLEQFAFMIMQSQSRINEVKKTFDFIDYSLEEGLEKAMRKFGVSDKKQIKQKQISLFGRWS